MTKDNFPLKRVIFDNWVKKMVIFVLINARANGIINLGLKNHTYPEKAFLLHILYMYFILTAFFFWQFSIIVYTFSCWFFTNCCVSYPVCCGSAVMFCGYLYDLYFTTMQYLVSLDQDNVEILYFVFCCCIQLMI